MFARIGDEVVAVCRLDAVAYGERAPHPHRLGRAGDGANQSIFIDLA
jgi:hypothetical protein